MEGKQIQKNKKKVCKKYIIEILFIKLLIKI